MSQIEELQSRLSAAMDRIGAGVEALAARPAQPPQTEGEQPASELAALLEDERMANAQLQERLKAVKARHEREIAELKAAAADDGRTDALKEEVERLRADLEAARDEARTLREELETARAELGQLQDAARGERDSGAALQQEVETLRRETESQAAAMVQLDRDVQRVREANRQLREVNAALRKAAEEKVGDPDLVNKAMLAELEGLRAAHAADAAEAGAILARLDVLLSNAANLPEGEEE